MRKKTNVNHSGAVLRFVRTAQAASLFLERCLQSVSDAIGIAFDFPLPFSGVIKFCGFGDFCACMHACLIVLAICSFLGVCSLDIVLTGCDCFLFFVCVVRAS